MEQWIPDPRVIQRLVHKAQTNPEEKPFLVERRKRSWHYALEGVLRGTVFGRNYHKTVCETLPRESLRA